MKRVLVIGATGDVGYGIITVGTENGWQLIAVGRSEEKLEQLKAEFPDVQVIAGDLSSQASADRIWSKAEQCFGGIDAVIVSVSAPLHEMPVLEYSPDGVMELFKANLMTHFIAAKTFIPKLTQEAIFIGLGGGMADFLLPNVAPVSMAQSAQRIMYRAIANEAAESAPMIKEMMVYSMVNGRSRRDIAKPSWITDVDIGRHLYAIIENPSAFPDTILTLKSRDQVGSL